jgi:hypothetical protein
MSAAAAPGGREGPLDLFRHLPAIYAARRKAGDPFSLLVEALAEGHRDIEARLALVPAMLDPRTAPAGFDRPRRLPPGEERLGFLEFLAGWVALDPALLGERDRARPAEAPPPDPRTRVLRHLVENAAPLQAARGTVAGLRYLLEVLFDAEVEILEWRWPTAFRPGVAASLGADTLLMGEPPLDRCVTLLFDSPWLRQAIAPVAAAVGGAFGLVELAAGDRGVGAVIMTEAAGPDGLDPMVAERLERLHAVLKRELPAHVLGYVGFRPGAGAEAAALRPFVVGVGSTLGHVQIQRRS